jgi:hypothetical protein
MCFVDRLNAACSFVLRAGTQLLSEQQLADVTQDWLYQQIQNSLSPAVAILKVRELELVYLAAAFDVRWNGKTMNNSTVRTLPTTR